MGYMGNCRRGVFLLITKSKSLFFTNVTLLPPLIRAERKVPWRYNHPPFDLYLNHCYRLPLYLLLFIIYFFLLKSNPSNCSVETNIQNFFFGLTWLHPSILLFTPFTRGLSTWHTSLKDYTWVYINTNFKWFFRLNWISIFSITISDIHRMIHETNMMWRF